MLFVGRLVPEKGVDALVEAASRLRDLKVLFVIVGDGPLRAALEASASENVVFLGALHRDDVSALLSQSNIVCLPSRSEGFATVLLEASAWGVPSCVTHVGGSSEIVCNEGYGWLLNSMDSNELAVTLKKALQDRKLLARQGERVQNLVEERYTWIVTADLLLSAFRLDKQ